MLFTETLLFIIRVLFNAKAGGIYSDHCALKVNGLSGQQLTPKT
jgi:hypothetical protein